MLGPRGTGTGAGSGRPAPAADVVVAPGRRLREVSLRIWFDADNGPHVLILRPLAAELTRRGHQVSFTARDRAGTCELLDLYGLAFARVGREFGTGRWHKVGGTLGRAAVLARRARRWRPDVSFGHGSRSLPLASALLGIPSVTMYDYEWVDPTLFNVLCRTILLPDVVDPARCADAGIRGTRVRRYPGLKEHLYLGDQALEPAPVQADLGLRPDRVKVLLRPPATKAHYHNPDAEILLQEILRLLVAREDVQVVFLSRDPSQVELLGDIPRERVIMPQRVYDGPSLVAAMDLVISGGGTMTREAAVLGVPSYSYFRGRTGRVDESLESAGRLVMLRSAAEVPAKLQLTRRTAPVSAPDSAALVGFICDAIEAAATRARSVSV